MKISEEEVKHIAKLARLKIDDDKLADFKKDMEKIVAMVEGLPDIEDEDFMSLEANDYYTESSNNFFNADSNKNY